MPNFDAAGYHWECRPGAEDLVSRILESPEEIVREIPLKKITRHHVDGRLFYVKRHRHDAVAGRPWKFLFKAPRAQGEWRNALALEQLQVPCVPHIAHGERRGKLTLLESVLITEAPADHEPVSLSEIDEPKVAEALGRFVRHLHDRGVYHRDFHPGNLLFDRARGTFCLVDLDNIKLLAPLTPARRVQWITHRARWLSLTPAFGAGYGPELAGHRSQIAAARSQRAFEEGWRFRHQKFGARTWQVRVTGPNEGLPEILAAPETALAGRDEAVGGHWRVQWYPAGGAAESGGRIAYRIAYHLECLGVPAELAVAFCAEPDGSTLIVWQHSPASRPLERVEQIRHGACDEAATLLGRFHNDGFVHDALDCKCFDFSPANQPFIGRLERARFVERVTEDQAVADLVRLARSVTGLSRTKRARFLRRYAATREQGTWRSWWQAVAASR